MNRMFKIIMLALALCGAGSMAKAQRLTGAEPGAFDYYVLALSWSPAYCDSKGDKAPRLQCGARPFGFIVRGLWPQAKAGFPEYCTVPAPELERSLVGSMLDIMPSPALIRREWQAHGTCAGEKSARDYFESVRKMRAMVKIPADFQAPAEPRTLAPAEVAAAFKAANPQLGDDSMAVVCDSERLREVRVCIGRDYAFRPCPEVASRSCRRDQLTVLPVRQSAAAAQ